jgi:hypothetical protein
MLTPGNNNNFATVWPKLIDKATETYGRTAQIMEKGVAYQQPAIDVSKYRVQRPFRVDPVWRDTRYHSHSHSYMHWKGGMGNCNYPVGRRCV